MSEVQSSSSRLWSGRGTPIQQPGFLLAWVLASAAAWGLAAPLGHALGHAVGAPMRKAWDVFLAYLLAREAGLAGLAGGAPHGGALFGIMVGVVFGMLIGVAQGSVLRRQLSRPTLWVAATLVGWSLSFFAVSLANRVLGTGVGFPMGWIERGAAAGLIDGVAVGALVGIAQWAVLRRHVQWGGAWVLASTIGMAAAWLLSWVATEVLALSIGWALAVPAGWAVGGAVAGSITGATMSLLFRQHPAELQPADGVA